MPSDSESESGENPLIDIVRGIESSPLIENRADTEEGVTEEVGEETASKKKRGRGRKKTTISDVQSAFDRVLPDEPNKRDLKSGLSVVLMEELIKRLYEFKDEANDVLEEFLTFEGMWSGRTYPRFFTKLGIVTPITYFKGASSANVDWFYNDFYEKISDIRHHKEELTQKIQEIADPQKYVEKLLKDYASHAEDEKYLASHPEQKRLQEIPTLKKYLRREPDASLEAIIYNVPKVQEILERIPIHAEVLLNELNVTNSIFTVAEWVTEKMEKFTEQYRRFDLPNSEAAVKATDFRKLLNRILGLGRNIDILFSLNFAQVLMNHPELREDYQQVEEKSLTLVRRLYIKDAKIKMPPKEFVEAFREILSRLYLMKGDCDAIINRLLQSMAPEPDVKILAKAADSIFKRIQESDRSERKKRKKDAESEGE